MSGYENINKFGRFVEKKSQHFLLTYIKLCPSFYHVCFDPIGQHKKVRSLLGFFLGFSLAIIFYVTIILDLAFDKYTTLVLGSIIVIMLSIGCASSIQV